MQLYHHHGDKGDDNMGNGCSCMGNIKIDIVDKIKGEAEMGIVIKPRKERKNELEKDLSTKEGEINEGN